jgi:hypothetical protein
MRFFLLSYLLLFTSAAFAAESMAPSPADETSTTSMAPSPVPPRVFTGKICIKTGGCDCPEGDCNMPLCLGNCHCGGGECSMPVCLDNCFCPGGDCYLLLRSDLSMQPAVSYDACTSSGTCFCGESRCDDCDGGGCSCGGGNCKMNSCTENCSCNGGNCKMNSCTEDCSCNGGNCQMKACTKDCSCNGRNCKRSAADYQTFQPWAAGLVTCLALFLSMD